MEEVGGTLLEYEDEQEEKERGHDTREEILWERAKHESHLRGHIEAYYYRNFWKICICVETM